MRPVTAAAAADHRRRLLLGARLAGARSRPTTTSGRISAAAPATRSTRWPSRRRSRTRSWPGIDIVSDGELRRDNDIDYLLARIPGVDIPQPGQDRLLRLLRRRRSPAAARPAGEPASAWAGRRLRVHPAADRPPVKFSFTGPFSLSRRIRNERLRRTRPTWCGPSPGCSTREARGAGRGRRRRCCRSTSRSSPATRRTSSWRSRPSTSSPRTWTPTLGAARLLRQPLRPAAVGGPLRLPVPGRARRARRPAACWSSPARATTTCELIAAARLGPRARARRDRREDRRGGAGRSWSRPGSAAALDRARPSG